MPDQLIVLFKEDTYYTIYVSWVMHALIVLFFPLSASVVECLCYFSFLMSSRSSWQVCMLLYIVYVDQLGQT